MSSTAKPHGTESVKTTPMSRGPLYASTHFALFIILAVVAAPGFLSASVLIALTIVILADYIFGFYTKFMAIPDKFVREFVIPPRYLMALIAEPILLVLPMKLLQVENIPTAKSEKIIFVGNHQVFSMDAPVAFYEIYKQTGVYPRPLGDRLHFSIPFWKHLLMFFGIVEGSRDICGYLMKKGEPILVFPGGSTEVFRPVGEFYDLKWGKRTGFAKLAAQHGYKIIPFASVGLSDCFKFLMNIPVKYFYLLMGDSKRASKTTESLPVPLPFFQPQTNYLWFGEPIDSSKYNFESESDMWELRERVRLSIESGIQECFRVRAKDPERVASWFQAVRRWCSN